MAPWRLAETQADIRANTMMAASEVTASAHGRVNLIGEHTDYHEGFVLPALLPQRTTVRLRVRTDREVHARTATLDEPPQTYRLGEEAPGRGWLDYLQGVTVVVAASGLALPGFEVSIDSTVPVGAGVSSSAALEVALLRALRSAVPLALSNLELAQLCHRAETGFVGAPVGIMDHMACSLGREGEALFIDTRTLEHEPVPLPPEGALIVIDSGVVHRHAGGEYVTRRRESAAAAAALGVGLLRDAGSDALSRLDALPPLLARRARHVISENQRVLDVVEALEDGDLARVGDVFNVSHLSMRDDYEVSTAEVDTLVALGQADPDVYGARLTGGGFGGAVVMLARRPRAQAAAARIVDAYLRQTGRAGSILVPLPER